MKGFFNGFFALGLIVGVGAAFNIHLFFISPCPTEQSILWFCGEQPKIILRVLEFLEITFAAALWPATIILLVLFFRKEIGRLIDRLKEIGTKGAKFGDINQQQSDLPHKVQQTELSNQKLAQLPNKIAADIENKFKKDLESFDKGQKEPTLLRALTFEYLNHRFAIAYSNIFGSQIRALERLNEGSLPKREAEIEFEELKKSDPIFAEWNLMQYVKYLDVWGFIDCKDENYTITENGKSFLLYLTQQGLSKNRLH